MSSLAEQILELVESDGFSTFGWQGDPFTDAGMAAFDQAMAANRAQKIERIQRLILQCAPPQQQQAAPGAVPDGWKLYGNRQDFERYAAEQGYRDFEKNEFDGYKNSHTQARWNFWRAGQDAMLSAAPNPKEPV